MLITNSNVIEMLPLDHSVQVVSELAFQLKKNRGNDENLFYDLL